MEENIDTFKDMLDMTLREISQMAKDQHKRYTTITKYEFSESDHSNDSSIFEQKWQKMKEVCDFMTKHYPLFEQWRMRLIENELIRLDHQ
jgi:hypothetical protein